MKSITLKMYGLTWHCYPEAKGMANRMFFHVTWGISKRTGRKTSFREYLHRRIWLNKHGSIKPGFCVRFKDGNAQNVSLSNLECVSHSKFSRDNFYRHTARIHPAVTCKCGRVFHTRIHDKRELCRPCRQRPYATRWMREHRRRIKCQTAQPVPA